MKYGKVAAVRIPATIEHIVRIANAWTARPCWSKCPPVGIDTLRQSPCPLPICQFPLSPEQGAQHARPFGHLSTVMPRPPPGGWSSSSSGCSPTPTPSAAIEYQHVAESNWYRHRYPSVRKKHY